MGNAHRRARSDHEDAMDLVARRVDEFHRRRAASLAGIYQDGDAYPVLEEPHALALVSRACPKRFGRGARTQTFGRDPGMSGASERQRMTRLFGNGQDLRRRLADAGTGPLHAHQAATGAAVFQHGPCGVLDHLDALTLASRDGGVAGFGRRRPSQGNDSEDGEKGAGHGAGVLIH